MNVLDIFAGVGGLSWGFYHAGFNLIGGIDIWGKALKVFREAHPGTYTLQADLSKLSEKEIVKKFKNVDIIVGGPPCQAFSTVGKRALDDPRAFLVKEFIKVIKIFKPVVFVFENVKGFTSFAKGSLLRELLEELNALGYYLTYDILNVVNFAAPQNRERFILIGSLIKTIQLPKGNYVKRRKYWTFREATSDLPPVQAGQQRKNYISPPQNELQAFYRFKNEEILTLHESPNYSVKLLKMMEYIPEGKSAHDPEVFKKIPSRWRPTSGYRNTYKRILWDAPAPTITRNFCVPSSSNCIHPVQNRALTPREAARIQTFPDDYPFEGSSSDIRLMIGNAVPPFLSFGLAIAIAAQLGMKLQFSERGVLVKQLIDIDSLKKEILKGNS